MFLFIFLFCGCCYCCCSFCFFLFFHDDRTIRGLFFLRGVLLNGCNNFLSYCSCLCAAAKNSPSN